MNFTVKADRCDGYRFTPGTEFQCADAERGNQWQKEFDAFCDLHDQALCEGDDGKLYAVAFDYHGSEPVPYIWREVERYDE